MSFRDLFGGIPAGRRRCLGDRRLMIPHGRTRLRPRLCGQRTVNAAIIALLIPPSHNMIIYSIAAGGNLSVADLFTAGILACLPPHGHRLVGRAPARLSGRSVPGWRMVGWRRSSPRPASC
jgi:hypothetical protein